jgi:hypothetical protein
MKIRNQHFYLIEFTDLDPDTGSQSNTDQDPDLDPGQTLPSQKV